MPGMLISDAGRTLPIQGQEVWQTHNKEEYVSNLSSSAEYKLQIRTFTHIVDLLLKIAWGLNGGSEKKRCATTPTVFL